MNRIQSLLTASFAVLLLLSCSGRKDIADLFTMDGCSGPCYQRMPCEGQEVTLAFEITGSNVLKNGQMFFVRDGNDADKTIKIEFDASIPQEKHEELVNSVGKTAVVKGHIEGYDLLNPQSCRRAHLIYVSRAEDIAFE